MSTSCRRNYQTLIVRNSVVPNQCRPEPPLISVPGIDSDLVQRWMTGGGTPRRLIIPHSRLDAYSHQTRWYQPPHWTTRKYRVFDGSKWRIKNTALQKWSSNTFRPIRLIESLKTATTKKNDKGTLHCDFWHLTDPDWSKNRNGSSALAKEVSLFAVSVNYISKTKTEPGIKLMGCIGSNKAKCHSTQIKSRISTIKCILTGLMY